MKRRLCVAFAVVVLLAGCKTQPAPTPPQSPSPTPTVAAVLVFSLTRYPTVADHVQDAIAAGESQVCTIDRGGAAHRRALSLKGHATAPGKDRDEYPPAMCLEGGAGADVRLVPSGENRAAGAWMENRMAHWPDGTRVRLTVGP